MVSAFHLYLDDSGTRHPDRKPGRAANHGYDWFGLGGVLVRQEDEEPVRASHAQFLLRWAVDAPLRSADIRARSGPFARLAREVAYEEFLEDLYQLMRGSPLLGIGCVIDRPGYNERYAERYGRQRWLLCKTAFSVVVERAAKHARRHGRKLRVFVERSDRKTDRQMKEYYEALRTDGMPFDSKKSSMYAPLNGEQLHETLYEFRVKHKSSPVMQLADLYLWPMCIGGYNPDNRPYARLKADRKLIDCHLQPEEVPMLGIKYSCWELVDARRGDRKQLKPGTTSGPQGSHPHGDLVG